MTKKLQTPAKTTRKFHNLRLASLLILIPLAVGAFTLYFLFSEVVNANLGNAANKRLETIGSSQAVADLTNKKPVVKPQFSYYQLRTGQNLQWASNHFSVSLSTLQTLNPGTPVPGTLIKIPPVEQPLTPLTATSTPAFDPVIQVVNSVVTISNSFENSKINLNFEQFAALLEPSGVIKKTAPKQYRLLKPVSINDNIRLDITSDSVTRLQLLSNPKYDLASLTFLNSEVLIKGVSITSIDSTTNQPDVNVADGRSFVRALENSRMDFIDSHASYLGMDLDQLHDPVAPILDKGGIYGISWRISANTYGKQLVTGWVEGSTFAHNRIGAYTFGASGMQWRKNLFTYNDIYGLNPHDDSNNATIENNLFSYNGKHGFIMSKRCDYNVIRNNISVNNKLHGFMLHASSNYNLIENNTSIGNMDSFAIYNSNANILQNNISYNPRGSHVRINGTSSSIYILDNQFYEGSKGIYVYDNSRNVLIANNKFQKVAVLLTTNKASQVVYSDNTSEQIGYKIASGDRVVFGLNDINRRIAIDQSPLEKVYY